MLVVVLQAAAPSVARPSSSASVDSIKCTATVKLRGLPFSATPQEVARQGGGGEGGLDRKLQGGGGREDRGGKLNMFVMVVTGHQSMMMTMRRLPALRSTVYELGFRG